MTAECIKSAQACISSNEALPQTPEPEPTQKTEKTQKQPTATSANQNKKPFTPGTIVYSWLLPFSCDCSKFFLPSLANSDCGLPTLSIIVSIVSLPPVAT